MLKTFKEIIQYRHALWLLIGRDLANRYKGSVMGVFWLVLQPLLMVAVYTFVFSVILKVRMAGTDNSYLYAFNLIVAMMPFFAFQDAVTAATHSLFANSALLQKSTLPPVLFPLVPALSTLLTEVLALMVIITLAGFLLDDLFLSVLFLPVLVMIRLFLSIAASYFISVLAVFIPDIRQAIGLILTMVLFLTPIFYPVTSVPENFRVFNDYNPFYHLLEGYRTVILKGELPDCGVYWVALFALLSTFLGMWFFQKTINRAKDFV